MKSYIANKRKKESIIDRSLKRFKYDPIKQRLLYNTLPQPLKPTPYTPPKPVPKPRTKRIALPRKQVPKKVTEKVKKIKKTCSGRFHVLSRRQKR